MQKESWTPLACCILIYVLPLQCNGFVPSDIYGFQAKNIRGELVNLSIYRGKVLLIVNVASECGYTDNHYKELNELQNIFNDGSFLILAFPCNQFGAQEPKRNSAIEKFVKHTYDVDFPLFSKVQVIGDNAHPLYKWLKSVHGVEPNWNFGKFLINRSGQVVKFEPPTVSPLAMLDEIERLIIHQSVDPDETEPSENNKDEL